MKKTILTICTLSLGLCVSAQSVETSLFSAAAEESEGETISLQWTLGDMMVATQTTESGLLTEGFIQPRVIIPDINSQDLNDFYSEFSEEIQISIWPTPVIEFLSIKIENEGDQRVFMRLYDFNGSELHDKELDRSFATERLDLSDRPAGNYLLRFQDIDGRTIHSFIVTKIR